MRNVSPGTLDFSPWWKLNCRYIHKITDLASTRSNLITANQSKLVKYAVEFRTFRKQKYSGKSIYCSPAVKPVWAANDMGSGAV